MAKILIVEDDVNISKALKVRLTHEGHTIINAFDAYTGFSTALKEEPDLVILDISMPGGSGLDICRKINENTKLLATPIIFLTANKAPEIKERAEQLGCAAFFEKPYDSDVLMQAVNTTLSA